MNIANLCQRHVITVRPEDELTKAAEVMRANHVGYLVVADRDREGGWKEPVGVLTDRDIVITVVARKVDPGTLRVADVMTQQPVTVLESHPVDHALREMRRIGVRRLPVVDRRGNLTGVLSFDDVLDSVAGELQHLATSIRNERRIESTLRP